ncbi:helix-turn-helix transcriptional regulator [Dasania marina]|uniref:helix-turn-helix transcriptional regulator n=1 Tax=Dasania marina TaxID=471499 RepID=UPI00036569B6|nr:helix-turn-helix transcriptional regulator [Dasania marina]
MPDIDALKRWHQLIADGLTSQLAPELAGKLIAAIKLWLNFDTAIVLLYPSQQAPVLLYDDYPRPKRQQAVIDYTHGVYLLDPFYSALKKQALDSIYHLNDFAPDNFEDSEYYQTYYRGLDLADELGIFIPLDSCNTVIISLARRNHHGVFSRDDLNTLETTLPLLKAVVQQFYTLQPHQHNHTLSPVSSAFENFGDGKITAREQQVAQLILQGHSSKSLAKALDISPSTIKVHRKNIYERLNINTQAELFNLFLLHLDGIIK